jgi:hypothetical protein
MKLDSAPWSASKLGKRVLKHAVWIFIGVATGGAWIFYFADAPTLLMNFLTGQCRAGCLYHRSHPDGDDLYVRRADARAGLHLHVPMAAHPGGDARREFAGGDLQ